ncbi:MAG: hypothetical protein CSB49_05720 [Proteobacteria bacterium]|nr:MAG: hypothetical protein CSB49_05720 [Pseudomonadota bacterium]
MAAKAYQRGKAAFSDRDYLGALEAFEQAYKLHPHYLMQCNIARAHERLVDMINAARHYRRCLAEGGKRRRRTRRRVERALKAVQARISYVDVRAPGGGAIYVDGKRVGEVPKRVPLNPGRRTIEVRRMGASPASTTLTTRGGELRIITLQPAPLSTRKVDRDERGPRKSRPPLPKARSRGVGQAWFWVSAAATAGLAAAATVAGLRALSAKDDYESTPTRDGYTTAQDRRLVANILWAATLAAAAGTTTLFFFTDFKGSSARGKERELVVGVGLRGTF